MNIAYADPEGGQPIEEVFDDQEVAVLEKMNIKLQGKTKKLQNHHDPKKQNGRPGSLDGSVAGKVTIHKVHLV
ncbi:MAG: hypothetical protein WBA61_13840 [Aequorivita sp.]